jgi:hypothetical protein
MSAPLYVATHWWFTVCVISSRRELSIRYDDGFEFPKAKINTMNTSKWNVTGYNWNCQNFLSVFYIWLTSFITLTLNSSCILSVHSPTQLVTIYVPCTYYAVFTSLLSLLHFNCFPRLKMVSTSICRSLHLKRLPWRWKQLGQQNRWYLYVKLQKTIFTKSTCIL